MDYTTGEFVMTPAGRVHKSKVHVVPKGGRIQHTSTHVRIIASDGSVVHSVPLLDKRSARGLPTHRAAPAASGNAAVFWNNIPTNRAQDISLFSTTWTVPPLPKTKDATIFIFNSLQRENFNLLEAVLQWRPDAAGQGDHWTISCWYITDDLTEFITSEPRRVEPGQVLTGEMSSVATDKDYTYTAFFSNFAEVSLVISSPQPLNTAVEGLQIFHGLGPMELPNGEILMDKIEVSLADGTHPPQIDWEPLADIAEGFGVEVLSYSSTNGSVILKAPPSSK